jgi:hypothetical protein
MSSKGTIVVEQDVERTIGKLEAKAEHHHDRLQRIEEKLDHLVATMDEAKGSWKTIVGIGALSATVTGFVIEGLAYLGIRHS